MKNIFFFFGFFFSIISFGQEPVFENLSALQCDSLIQANAENPNFVILDVRKPSEHIPQHLEGAINRNYYDTDFSEQVNALNKEKMYLIHCKSGGRSGATFNLMQTMDFTAVFNMQHGINDWNSNSLPTTTEFAPVIMFVSDNFFPFETINIGEIDTITVILTNRANDTLQFNSVSSLSGTEFSTNFNIDTTLLGAEDYAFDIYYEPQDEGQDLLIFDIESNVGTVQVTVERTGLSILPELTLISDSTIDFGLVDITAIDSQQVVISNTGLSDLSFSSVVQIFSQFYVEFDVDTVISPGNDYMFYAYFQPSLSGADSITVTIESNGGTCQLLLKGTGNDATDIDEKTYPELTIYPNPSTNTLNICGLSKQGTAIEIITLSGQIIYKNNLQSDNHVIDVSNFQKGIYFLKVYDDENLVSKKFMVR